MSKERLSAMISPNYDGLVTTAQIGFRDFDCGRKITERPFLKAFLPKNAHTLSRVAAIVSPRA